MIVNKVSNMAENSKHGHGGSSNTKKHRKIWTASPCHVHMTVQLLTTSYLRTVNSYILQTQSVNKIIKNSFVTEMNIANKQQVCNNQIEKSSHKTT